MHKTVKNSSHSNSFRSSLQNQFQKLISHKTVIFNQTITQKSNQNHQKTNSSLSKHLNIHKGRDFVWFATLKIDVVVIYLLHWSLEFLSKAITMKIPQIRFFLHSKEITLMSPIVCLLLIIVFSIISTSNFMAQGRSAKLKKEVLFQIINYSIFILHLPNISLAMINKHKNQINLAFQLFFFTVWSLLIYAACRIYD